LGKKCASIVPYTDRREAVKVRKTQSQQKTVWLAQKIGTMKGKTDRQRNGREAARVTLILRRAKTIKDVFHDEGVKRESETSRGKNGGRKLSKRERGDQNEVMLIRLSGIED